MCLWRDAAAVMTLSVAACHVRLVKSVDMRLFVCSLLAHDYQKMWDAEKKGPDRRGGDGGGASQTFSFPTALQCNKQKRWVAPADKLWDPQQISTCACVRVCDTLTNEVVKLCVYVTRHSSCSIWDCPCGDSISEPYISITADSLYLRKIIL